MTLFCLIWPSNIPITELKGFFDGAFYSVDIFAYEYYRFIMQDLLYLCFQTIMCL